MTLSQDILTSFKLQYIVFAIVNLFVSLYYLHPIEILLLHNNDIPVRPIHLYM